MPSISVLHVLAPARFGGLESSVSSLAPALGRRGARVAVALVVTPDEVDPHPLESSLDRAGVEVVRMTVPTRGYLEERRRVRDLLRRRSADVLHVHGYRPVVVDAPVARASGIPTVTTVHGYTGGGWRSRAYEWLQTRAFRSFDAVIAVSEKLAGELREAGVEAERIHVLRNAWQPSRSPVGRSEARKALGIEDDAFVVGWIGRLSSEKGPDVLVRAAAEVERDDIGFVVIGDGPMRRECEELARTLGVDHRLRWMGAVSDAGALLGAFDVVALTSWTEGTPMVLLEAIAAGAPVVSTAVGGIPDVVSSSEALLCREGSAGQIARAIEDILSEPDAAARRASAARRRLEAELAVEPWAERHLELYEEVIAAR